MNPLKKILHLLIIFNVLICAPCLLSIDWKMTGVAPGNVFDFDIDPESGNLHVVSVYQYQSGVIYTVLSPDGAQISQETIPNTGGESSNVAFACPTIAVDHNGNPHVCFRNFQMQGSEPYVTVKYSRNIEGSWSSPMTIVDNQYRAYYVRIASDASNRIHIVTGRANPGTIVGKFSYHRIVGGVKTSFVDIGDYRADNRIEVAASPDHDVHIVVGIPNFGSQNGEINYYKVIGGMGSPQFHTDIHSFSCHDRNGAPDVYADQYNNIHFSYGSRFDSEINDAPSIRYVKYADGIEARQIRLTPGSGSGACEKWKEDGGAWNGWGLSSIASNDAGNHVVVAYITKDDGDLFTVESTNGGSTWSTPQKMDIFDPWGATDGRTLHLIRAYKNNFYILYPHDEKNFIRMKYYFDSDETPPVADAGGPYEAIEGNTIIFDGSGSSDHVGGSGIEKYEWDLNQDGVYEFEGQDPAVSHFYADDDTFSVVLRVTDYYDNVDVDTALVELRNGTPVIDIGSDQTTPEGSGLQFHADITDPGTNTHFVVWFFNDLNGVESRTMNYDFVDEGVVEIKCIVVDDHKAFDIDSIYVTVQNLPPVADAGGPYSGSPNMPVQLTGVASDPGPNDSLAVAWDLDGDGTFEISDYQATFAAAQPGAYEVFFKADDLDGGVVVDTAVVTVYDYEPVILPMGTQSILEGQSFPVIQLDSYITHPLQNDSDMRWRVSGYQQFGVVLSNRKLSVYVPGPNWHGSETFRLIVTDLGGITDTTWVLFEVQSVNDTPVWTQEVPDYSFPEDSSLIIPWSILSQWVQDIDHATSTLSFDIIGQNKIQVLKDTSDMTFHISGPPEWHGSEFVQFKVSDPGGLYALNLSTIRVTSVADTPTDFTLIEPNYLNIESWPDSIEFLWENSYDPDQYAAIGYLWELYRVEPNPEEQLLSIAVTDTSFTWYPEQNDETGVYKWCVKAINQAAGIETQSTNEFYIRIQNASDVEFLHHSPSSFSLDQNYPNPFNPETMIPYALAKPGRIRLVIYNTLGQCVKILDEGEKVAGFYQICWRSRDNYGQKVPSGVYILRLELDSQVFMRKLILMQ